MLRWNRNQVYPSITLTLATLRWHECHIVNQALGRSQLQCTDTIFRQSVVARLPTSWCKTILKYDWSFVLHHETSIIFHCKGYKMVNPLFLGDTGFPSPLNNWPRQLGGLQVRWWWYDREEIGTTDFCVQQIRSKKIQLTFCGLRNVAAVWRLNDSHQTWKKRTTASTVLACHDTKLLNASGFRQLGLLQREMPHSMFWFDRPHTFPIHFSALLSMLERWKNHLYSTTWG